MTHTAASLEVQHGPRTDGLTQALGNIAYENFRFLNPTIPVFNDLGDMVADSLPEFLGQEETSLSVLLEDHTPIGFSSAVAVGRLDPTRRGWADTAYIFLTAIRPARQGLGLVRPIMDDMFRQLRGQDFRYVERDCTLAGNYADNVAKAYREAVVETRESTTFTLDRQRFFRIDLSRLDLG